MTIPSQTLRVIFAASVLASAFWLIGLAWEPAFGRDAPIPALILLASAVTAGLCWFAFRGGRLVVPGGVRPARLIGLVLSRFVLAYLVSAPVCGVVAWGLIQLFWPEPSHPEAKLLAWLLALWFPLWPAPAAAAVLAWRGLRGRP
ncbi:MAG: hypothetical protein AB1641_20045 [Thermodesulfobacteriota bacterium]